MITMRVYCRVCKRDISAGDDENEGRAFHYQPCPHCHRSNLTITFWEGDKETTVYAYGEERRKKKSDL